MFATSFLALAKNAIGVASEEPGEARERIGTANPRQIKFRQMKFRQMKFLSKVQKSCNFYMTPKYIKKTTL